MRLDATQAHILNEARHYHDAVTTTAERLADLTNTTTTRLAKGHADHAGDLAAIAGLATQLARFDAKREAAMVAAATFLGPVTVAQVLAEPFQFYMEGTEFVTDSEHADNVQQLRDRPGQPKAYIPPF